MNGFEFASRVIDAVAWPIAAVALALITRPLLRDVLGGANLRRVKIGPGGFEAEWDRLLAETGRRVQPPPPQDRSGASSSGGEPTEAPPDFHEDMLSLLDRASPSAAVVASHGMIDAELRTLLRGREVEPGPVNTTALAHLACEHGIISAATRDAVEGLGVMRLLAVMEGGRNLTREHAEEFLTLATATLYAVRRDASR